MSILPTKYLIVITAIFLAIASVQADSINIPNHSFEIPAIDPNGGFPAIPFTSSWTEDDVDVPLSRNTGTFLNTAPGNDDHLFNVDGNQLAFLNSTDGNAFWQYLPATYQQGKSYRLTVGVCISLRFPPPEGTPLILELHYLSGADPNDVGSIIFTQAPAPDPNSRTVEDFSVSLPTVQPGDSWAGKNIGIAIRATGEAGGYWDIDNVRLMEYPRTPKFMDDPYVNLNDFVMMAAEWQSCSEPETDVTGDGCVNLEDIMILAEYWLNDV